MEVRYGLLVTLSISMLACGGGASEPSRETAAPGGAGGGASGGENSQSPAFAEPNASQIRPGVLVSADGSSCTSNFIYVDGSGDYYIGAAAHCFSPDANSGRDSCETNNLPLGTAVNIENAAHSGSLYYSSWRSMQDNRETPASNVCRYNDFALIQIDRRDYGRVHPAAIAYEGPTGLLAGGAAVGDFTYSYGQSSFHSGFRPNEEKEGPIRQVIGNGWQYTVAFDNAGLPGDSGSAVLHESGQALGVLTVVSAGLSLTPVSNGVMNLEMGLDYANDSLGSNIKLVRWNRFSP